MRQILAFIVTLHYLIVQGGLAIFPLELHVKESIEDAKKLVKTSSLLHKIKRNNIPINKNDSSQIENVKVQNQLGIINIGNERIQPQKQNQQQLKRIIDNRQKNLFGQDRRQSNQNQSKRGIIPNTEQAKIEPFDNRETTLARKDHMQNQRNPNLGQTAANPRPQRNPILERRTGQNNHDHEIVNKQVENKPFQNLKNALFRKYRMQNRSNPNPEQSDVSPRSRLNQMSERRTAQNKQNDKTVDGVNKRIQNMPRENRPEMVPNHDKHFTFIKEINISDQNRVKQNHPAQSNKKFLNDPKHSNKLLSPDALPRLYSPYNFRRRAKSDSSSWIGCVDPKNSSTEHNRVEIEKRTTTCIVVSEAENYANGAKYWRWVFQPTADEYSHFTIKDSYKRMVSEHVSIHLAVHVESQQSLSYIRRYFDYVTDRIFPYLTALVTVDNGSVIGITWDESCLFCEENRCITNTYNFNGTNANVEPRKSCYIERKECDDLEDKKPCDLGIYFAWTGTDKNGKVLTSVNSRSSAFPPNWIPNFF